MTVVIVDAWVVTALVENPLLLAWSQFPLKLTVILANHALQRVVVAVTEVVRSFWNSLGSLDVVGDKGEAIWAETLEDFGVEAPVLFSRVGPVFLLEGQIVIEEVVSFDELASVPFRNVTSLTRNRTSQILRVLTVKSCTFRS